MSGDMETAKRARNIGFAMAMGFIAWMGVQLLGATLGLPPALVFVADAAAVVLFVWAMAATFRVWQKRREDRK